MLGSGKQRRKKRRRRWNQKRNRRTRIGRSSGLVILIIKSDGSGLRARMANSVAPGMISGEVATSSGGVGQHQHGPKAGQRPESSMVKDESSKAAEWSLCQGWFQGCGGNCVADPRTISDASFSDGSGSPVHCRPVEERLIGPVLGFSRGINMHQVQST